MWFKKRFSESLKGMQPCFSSGEPAHFGAGSFFLFVELPVCVVSESDFVSVDWMITPVSPNNVRQLITGVNLKEAGVTQFYTEGF